MPKKISHLIILFYLIQVFAQCPSSDDNKKSCQGEISGLQITDKSFPYLLKKETSIFLVSLFILCSYYTFEKQKQKPTKQKKLAKILVP